MTVEATDIPARIAATLDDIGVGVDTPVVIMVSGGGDSTALAYAAYLLRERGRLGPLSLLHVNHRLRGADADADARFVRALAEALDLPLVERDIDVGAIAQAEAGNIEAVARRERYAAAEQALVHLCRECGTPVADGRIATAHTRDDRVENFYMRSIVGTGPGGFRGMLRQNGHIIRPCLDIERDELRDWIEAATTTDVVPVVRNADGALWCEDATNAHTDRFRAYVRHEIVPAARARNPRLFETLCRTMDAIADEDDYLQARAEEIALAVVCPVRAADDDAAPTAVRLEPAFAETPVVLQRRIAYRVLGDLLGADARIERASVDAVVAAFADGAPVSGYTNNIQGDLALSANKHGLLIEPMADYRARRKGGNDER